MKDTALVILGASACVWAGARSRCQTSLASTVAWQFAGRQGKGSGLCMAVLRVLCSCTPLRWWAARGSGDVPGFVWEHTAVVVGDRRWRLCVLPCTMCVGERAARVRDGALVARRPYGLCQMRARAWTAMCFGAREVDHQGGSLGANHVTVMDDSGSKARQGRHGANDG